MIFDKVLLTGCAGDIALSMAKVLRGSGLVSQIFGCDIHDRHPGTYVYDQSGVVPKADAPGYWEALQAFGADLIIPTSETEIQFFKENGLPGLKANDRALDVGLDKLATVAFLKSSVMPFPVSGKVCDSTPENFPCITKSRFGQGSKEVSITGQSLFTYMRESGDFTDFIWQELLLPADEEYTCGLYRTVDGDVRSISFKRELKGGLTGFAEVICNEYIDKLLQNIAVDLDLRGSINVQLRLTDKGPVVFEINPRFSSTVGFRDLLGFRDLIWSLEEEAGLSVSDYTPPKENTKIFRGSKEYIMKEVV